MCVIIIKQKGNKVSQEVAKTSSRINPHGLGIIWLDTFEITYHKSSEYKVLDTERPFIAHFRYATVGAVNKDNTHPFRCGKNSNEWLMMNGTIRGLGNAMICDSKVLAINLGATPRDKWKAELSKHDCRFVTINTRTRTFQMYNREDWVQKDGVWYSKGNVLEDNLVAVYGTLKKNYNNYYSYLTDSKFVGSGQTKDKYPLIINGLPYLIEDIGNGHNVDVDVFKVSDSVLKNLDRLEGHPNWYCRKQIDIVVGKKILNCWIYFNLKESSVGKVHHKSYHQEVRKFTYSDTLDYIKWKPSKKYSAYDDFAFDDEVEVEEDFNIDNEKPICVDCYHDLEFDGFANYNCSGCNGWFTEDEVIRYKP